MIATKKSVIGFILLAVIVFPTAYLSWVPAPAAPIAGYHSHDFGTGPHQEIKYRPPLVTFPGPWEMAVVVTVVIEFFALLCYALLKKLEPAINKAAEKTMRELREKNHE